METGFWKRYPWWTLIHTLLTERTWELFHHVPCYIGPAKSLFKKPYFEAVRNALKPEGIFSAQGVCVCCGKLSSTANQTQYRAAATYTVHIYTCKLTEALHKLTGILEVSHINAGSLWFTVPTICFSSVHINKRKPFTLSHRNLALSVCICMHTNHGVYSSIHCHEMTLLLHTLMLGVVCGYATNTSSWISDWQKSGNVRVMKY